MCASQSVCDCQRYECNEEKYLQSIHKSLVRPIGGWTQNGFKKVYKIYAQYQRKLNEHNNNKNDENFFDLSLTKMNLKNEMKAILQYRDKNLVSHLHSYWKSYQKRVIARSQILSSTQHDNDKYDPIEQHQQKQTDGDDDDGSEYDENEYFDITAVDKQVGYYQGTQQQQQQRVIKYKVRLLHAIIGINNKYKRYKRVIYICKESKSVKVLGIKPEITEYALANIERVQKEYNEGAMRRLCLKFKDSKEYLCEFESAQQREKFASNLFEYEQESDKLLSIFVGSWNVGESVFSSENVSKWIPLSTQHDLYVIGLQEVKGKLKNKWINGLVSHINPTQNGLTMQRINICKLRIVH